MVLSIHDRTTQFLISLIVFPAYFGIIIPHLLDADPPLIVKILLKPAEVAAGTIGPWMPRGNIGTAERPVYEGTPFDLLVGLVLVVTTGVLYAAVTFFATISISKFIKR